MKQPIFQLESIAFPENTRSFDIQLDLSKPFSICFWLKTTFQSVSPIIAQMEDKAPFTGWDILINKENSQPGSLRFQLIKSFPEDFIEIETNAFNILDGEWHHLCILYDGSKNARKILLVIDGKKAPTIIISDNLDNLSSDKIPLTIGSRLNANPTFDGRFRNLMIFNLQLNLEDAQEIFEIQSLSKKQDEKSEIMILKNISKVFQIKHNARGSIKEILPNFFSRYNTEQRTVLEKINLSIKKGEFVGIIGKNGSGKSTLLKIMAGIIEPTQGEIIVNGRIAPFLSLGSGFNPELDARENIILYGMLLGHTKKSITSKIEEILKFAELEKYSDVKLKTFSSGMFMRLALSVAISLNPDIFLIDEVLAVGDESFQQKSFNKLISFRNQGKTIVFVTHNLEQVENLCDRAVLLKDGKIHSVGNPKEIVENYKKLIY